MCNVTQRWLLSMGPVAMIAHHTDGLTARAAHAPADFGFAAFLEAQGATNVHS